MTRFWLTAVLVQLAGLVLWLLGWQYDLGAVMPVALFIGTIVPASSIAVDLGTRYLPANAARFLRYALLLVNGVVGLAIGILHTTTAQGSFAFVSSVSVAIWGTVGLGLGLALLNSGLALQMARNYLRVPSGRAKGLGSILVAVGTVGLTLPLVVIDLVALWPVVAMPSMIVALMGQRRLDA